MATEAPPRIVSRDVTKVYETLRGPVAGLMDFSLDVGDGEFVCVVGPSGCGKSTYLRMLAGLDRPTSGTIEIRPGDDPGKPLNSVVFQEYAVFPWKTVIENVAFGLEMRGRSKAERTERAEYWLERVGLRKFAGHYPHQISGGMKQRVSIIRALANDPEVLLMDEPLGALDAQTRIVLQDELLRIWEETRKTVVYITHSLDEAILLGDRVILMSAHPGRLLETYRIDLERPRTIDTMNLPEFGELRGRIWARLAGEVSRAMEQQE
ncbi:MAG: ABC transporter ATP-binding protein [Rhizobiaceae bacterium]|nr:ABC transporter ATP-binding protein [Rhizobiaceae bacterium]MCV0408316.1 ABC transporter ATP-binding protein [Rhizobiaceae bacterium]